MSITGRYELDTSDNFDSYLKAAGLNIAKRAAAAAARPTVEISEADGVYTIKTLSVFKNTTITFKLGEEFDEETADGRTAKTTITLEGNKLTQTQKIDPDESTTVREFTDAGMTATFTCKDAVATRTYKRAA
ncbi:fatty acid-binding protein, heart [Folsomia candida]|nr:fatty acid-binding protein, heart [Folsomia candida]